MISPRSLRVRLSGNETKKGKRSKGKGERDGLRIEAAISIHRIAPVFAPVPEFEEEGDDEDD